MEGFAAALGIILVGFLITSAIQDAEGRNDWHHAAPLPSGVTKLSASDYLVTPASKQADSFCAGTNTDDDRVVSTKTLPNATYVKCGRGQSWGDSRAKSGNYADALSTVAGSFLFISIAIGILAACMAPGSASFLRERRRHRQHEEKRVKKAARARALDETKRVSLATAFGQGSIDREEFDRAIAALDNDDGN